MYQRIFLIAVTFSLATITMAQNTFRGQVLGIEAEGDTASLPNAVLKQIPSGTITLTNIDGNFSISSKEKEITLVISYIGKKTDTITLNRPEAPALIILRNNNTLSEVKVSYYELGSFRINESIGNVENISQSGLLKLACCNLSESFENNASIDAGFADAVSGARQIQLLGLSGKYSQMTTENIPTVRGLANSYGLSYIPGTWMESIQISKGTSSVINGYESVTGQINVEYKKPQKTDPLLLNLYQNSEGRSEANVVTSWNKDEKNGGVLMAHASKQWMKVDDNHDSFLDMPLSDLYSAFIRWNGQIGKKVETKSGIRYLEDHRESGQFDLLPQGQPAYRTNIKSQNLQAFNKTGFAVGNKPGTSLGFINDYTWYSQGSVFGNNRYSGTEQTYHLNVIYLTYIGDTRHKLTLGSSFMYDGYNENLNDSAFKRSEKVPGIYSEYNFVPNEKFSVMLGLRADYNSESGWLYTPRIHAKYKLLEHTTLRASAGKGYRMPNAIGDNMSVLASSRKLIWTESPKMEEAYNTGVNLLQEFKIAQAPWSLAFDLYHTEFVNQFVADVATDSRAVQFYNIDGRSYSTSFQSELKAQPVKRLELTLTYRYNDVKQSLGGVLQDKPFAIKHRGLFTASYATMYKKWQFDVTVQQNGVAKLPSTSSNPAEYQRATYSPGYTFLLTQVTRRFKNIEVYAGGENLTNYRQPNPIVAANDPFGQYFDASMIWGPVSGRMWYGGLRWTVK
jgi:hypothetical protein